jgi:hypothetical protein
MRMKCPRRLPVLKEGVIGNNLFNHGVHGELGGKSRALVHRGANVARINNSTQSYP